eukprot:6203846-Pleurochrysis_carterae.AAC.4
MGRMFRWKSLQKPLSEALVYLRLESPRFGAGSHLAHQIPHGMQVHSLAVEAVLSGADARIPLDPSLPLTCYCHPPSMVTCGRCAKLKEQLDEAVGAALTAMDAETATPARGQATGAAYK